MRQHKDKVSWLVLALIAVLTLASILNIIQKSASYHHGFSAKLIGIGFGLSLAVTVYVVMIADTAKTRWTAASFAVIFAAVSATIQTALYLDEHAPLLVALAYGVGVPGFEAALAILEALLRREVADEGHGQEVAALQLALAEAQSDTASADQAAETWRSESDGLHRQIEALTAKLAEANHQPPTESPSPEVAEPPTIRHRNRQPSAKLTAGQIAKCQQVAEMAEDGGFATDAELAERTGWSETTARRYRSLAEQQGIIAVNGDNRYHRR